MCIGKRYEFLFLNYFDVPIVPTNKILKYYDKCVMYITRNVLPIIIYENYYIPK